MTQTRALPLSLPEENEQPPVVTIPRWNVLTSALVAAPLAWALVLAVGYGLYALLEALT